VGSELPITRSRIELGVEERMLYCGAQLYVSVARQCVFDEAFGLARPARRATTDSIFPVWCTAKPVLALAILRMSDRYALDLDRPLEDLGPALRGAPIGRVTMRGVLSHRGWVPSGFAIPGAFASRHRVIEALRGLELEEPPDGVRYAPSWGFHAIGVALRELGIPLENVIRDEILDPLGIADLWLPIRQADIERDGDRLGVNWIQTRDVLRPIPIAGLELGGEPEFGLGGYASAKALGRLYEALLSREVVEKALVSESSYEAMVTPAGPPGHDPIQQRVCTYGLGMMVDMSNHGFGESCSPQSFGHSGGTGYMLAFADPRDELVVGAIFPSLEAGDVLTITARRPHLIQTIRQELDLL
jgi:CubicO group peptidase (beta-lactamase class C family)